MYCFNFNTGFEKVLMHIWFYTFTAALTLSREYRGMKVTIIHKKDSTLRQTLFILKTLMASTIPLSFLYLIFLAM